MVASLNESGALEFEIAGNAEGLEGNHKSNHAKLMFLFSGLVAIMQNDPDFVTMRAGQVMQAMEQEELAKQVATDPKVAQELDEVEEALSQRIFNGGDSGFTRSTN